MAYAGVLEDIKTCVRLGTPRRMPVLALTFEFDLRRAGLSWGDSRQDLTRMVRCQLEGVREFDYDWVMVFPDDYVEFEPLGLKMRADDNCPAIPGEYLPMSRETLQQFKFPDLGKDLRIPMHLEWIRRVKSALGDTVCVMGRVASPFSAAALVYGIEPFLIKMMEDQGLVRDNLSYFTEYEIAYGRAQLEAGADGLWLGDCVASSRFISLPCFAEFAIPSAAKVGSELVKGEKFIIYHTCETSISYLRLQAQLPVSAVNVGEGVSMAKVRNELGINKCLTGNLDPKLVRDGAAGEVAKATEELIRENLPDGGYIFCTGEDIMQTTPPANLAAMLKTARTVASEVLSGISGNKSPGQ
jgi:MtaA/CmuA family methyltransferase